MDRSSPEMELSKNGFCVLPSVFSRHEIDRYRQLTMACLGMMGRTRNVAHSWHLAGFHRFPQLVGLHAEIASNGTINDFLSGYYENAAYYAIGLSDITVNRSQQWHTDLLRGRYGAFLQNGVAWAERKGSCVKALLYLQTGKSLRIVPGSHHVPSPLDDAALHAVAQTMEVVQLEVNAGDVVMMDIRALHRGSTDAEMSDPALADNPKVLISTVFGKIDSGLTQAMQIGNAQRMADWDRRYLR